MRFWTIYCSDEAPNRAAVGAVPVIVRARAILSPAVMQNFSRTMRGRACSKRLCAHATGEHFALTDPVSVRFSGLGPVEALASAVLGLFARPALGHLVWAGVAGPGQEHLPRLPMPGIGRIRLRLLADRLRSYSQRQF